MKKHRIQLPEMLWARITDATEDFSARTGLALLDVLRLPRGEVAAALAGVGEDRPRFAVAVELGAERQTILDLLRKVDGRLEATGGGPEFPRAVTGGLPVVLWPAGPDAKVARAVLGTHVVFAYPADFLVPIIRAHREGQSKAQSRAAFLEDLSPRLALKGDREALVVVDLAGIRAALRARRGENPGPPDEADLLFQASGLEGANTLGMALGFLDGGLEFKLHLSTPGGPQGLLGAVASSISPLEKPEVYLERVPADSSGLLALRLQPGKLFLDGLSAISAAAPEVGDSLRRSLREAEEALGVSLKEEDLKSLPPLGMVLFSMTPPAGNLLDDQIALFRTAEFRPYQDFLARALEASGHGFRVHDEGGRRIHYFSLGAFLDLGDGWTVFSRTLVALRRYVSHYASLKKAPDVPETFGFFRERIAGAQGAAILRGARSLLGCYNTLVSLANVFAPSFEAYLTPYGIDPGLLPAGEEFLAEAKDGSLRFEIGPEGLGLHGHRVLRNTGLLSVVAGVSIISGIAIPNLIVAKETADSVRCQSNLREIHRVAILEAEKSGAFPYSPKGGWEAVKVLAASQPEPWRERVRCPSHGEDPGYELVPWRLTRDAPPDAILAFDIAAFHKRKRNVVYLNGSVESLSEAAFKERLESDRKRFAEGK